MKRYILKNGRPSHFPPCKSHLIVRENLGFSEQLQPYNCAPKRTLQVQTMKIWACQSSVKLKMENLLFIKVMEKSFFFLDFTNSWVAPLPFHQPQKSLPNNRQYAMSRLKSLHHTLDKNPEMKSHCMDFMQKMLYSHHAEPALPTEVEFWGVSSTGIHCPCMGFLHPPWGHARKTDGIENRAVHFLWCFGVKAISVVAYLKVTGTDGTTELGFVLGKSRLAPLPKLTVYRQRGSSWLHIQPVKVLLCVCQSTRLHSGITCHQSRTPQTTVHALFQPQSFKTPHGLQDHYSSITLQGHLLNCKGLNSLILKTMHRFVINWKHCQCI